MQVQGLVGVSSSSAADGSSLVCPAGKAGDKKLWIERDTHILAFPPFERCPQGNRIHDFWRNIRYRLHGRTAAPAGS